MSGFFTFFAKGNVKDLFIVFIDCRCYCETFRKLKVHLKTRECRFIRKFYREYCTAILSLNIYICSRNLIHRSFGIFRHIRSIGNIGNIRSIGNIGNIRSIRSRSTIIQAKLLIGKNSFFTIDIGKDNFIQLRFVISHNCSIRCDDSKLNNFSRSTFERCILKGHYNHIDTPIILNEVSQ